jgi:hypothetical protein
MRQLYNWWKSCDGKIAFLIVSLLLALVIVISILFPQLEWNLFIALTPSIIAAAGVKWIAPKCKPEKATKVILGIIAFIAYVAELLDKFHINILHILFKAIINNSQIFIFASLFVALLSPLERIVERQTIRNGSLQSRDVKYWILYTLSTNTAGWIALYSVVSFTLLNSGIENAPLLDSDYANPILRMLALCVFYIVIGFVGVQQKTQEELKKDTSRWDHDIEQDFSLGSICQISNVLWLMWVGLSIIICVSHILSYAASSPENIKWDNWIILTLGVLPFFVSASIQREHKAVYYATYVVGTAALLITQIIYILLNWEQYASYRQMIILPSILLVAHIIIVIINEIKHKSYLNKLPFFCVAYICAALSSFSMMAILRY